MSLTEEQQKELMGCVKHATATIKKLRADCALALDVIHLQREMLTKADTLITHLATFIKKNQLEPPVDVPEKYYLN
jgi:hypothetical protein